MAAVVACGSKRGRHSVNTRQLEPWPVYERLLVERDDRRGLSPTVRNNRDRPGEILTVSDDQDDLLAMLMAWRRDIDSEPFGHIAALRDFAQRWAASRCRPGSAARFSQ